MEKKSKKRRRRCMREDGKECGYYNITQEPHTSNRSKARGDSEYEVELDDGGAVAFCPNPSSVPSSGVVLTCSLTV
jgi:hypothetical protein